MFLCSMFTGLQHGLFTLWHGMFLVPTLQHGMFLRHMKTRQLLNSLWLHFSKTQVQMALQPVNISSSSCSHPVQTINSFRSPPVHTTINTSQSLHYLIFHIKIPSHEANLITEYRVEKLHIMMTRGEGSFKGTMPIMETYLVSSPWQKARRRHHVAIMDLSDSSQNNNASVDCNISIEESSTFHLQLAIITKHHDPVIQVPITSNHVDNRFCCITTNRNDKGLSCTSTRPVSIGGFYNHQYIIQF